MLIPVELRYQMLEIFTSKSSKKFAIPDLSNPSKTLQEICPPDQINPILKSTEVHPITVPRIPVLTRENTQSRYFSVGKSEDI